MDNLCERVHRQVHPRYYDQGIISDQAFVAKKDQDYQLSCTRSSLVSAVDARIYYTEMLSLESVGSAEVTVQDVVDANSRCVDDSAHPHNGLPPGHCYIDSNMPNKAGRKELREYLAEVATNNGLIS